MSEAEILSAASKEMLSKVRKIVPPMLDKFHKGQLGRIAVIGGSMDYTGAPFFSAMASARLGADMSHVICEPSAGAVIKTYSPNLMVSPLMRQSQIPYPADPSPPTEESVADGVIAMLPRLHVLVMGPGLGRDELMQRTCKRVLAAARERGMPVVLDADALAIVNADPSTVRGYKQAVLTPNVVEFGRLSRALGVDVTDDGGVAGGGGEACKRVARALEGACVVQKGQVDYVSDGERVWICDLEGGRKRSGGQGDTLTGCLGTFLCWRKAYMDRIWDVGKDGAVDEDELVMLAAWGGAAITRESSRLAFKSKGRSLQASDVMEMVPTAFQRLIGEKEESKL